MKESKDEPQRFYAHTKNCFDGKVAQTSEWEPLYTGCENSRCEGSSTCCEACGHLDKVARLSAKFAEEMFPQRSVEAKAARDWGWLAGLWHDLGKFASEFQCYLSAAGSESAHIEGVPGRVDHSTAGAIWAVNRLKSAQARVIAYVIAGHHSGLANIKSSDTGSGNRTLAERMDRPPSESTSATEAAALYFRDVFDSPNFPLKADPRNLERSSFDLSLFTRLLFSCLVDADRLCTEAFCDSSQANLRAKARPTLSQLHSSLHKYLEKLKVTAKPSSVNEIRNRVLNDCLEAAPQPPGLFSLTVPTGGGKTLSSLAFALRHALENPTGELTRVIYVIPFTSIIEQNAAEYRKVFSEFGSDVVLEHHCNLDTDEWENNPQARLRTENWDAPIIVTTAVQFYESLFASKTRRCRKLHNLARSVIILDEAQSLPVHFLQPCLWALDSLTKYFGSTVVFCTATQPSIQKTETFPIGFNFGSESRGMREIVRDSKKLYADLKRVRVENLGLLSDEDLGQRLNAESQTLCIVNTRKHAAKLFEQLEGERERNYHLSTRMCPQHRRKVLDTVKQRLRDGLPCRLISTSLIEAGVDVDFPSVYRCIAGMDSIAQAAGRCNREGLLEAGLVYVFDTDSEFAKVHPELAKPIDSTRLTLPHFEDPISAEAIEAYFKQHYSKYQSSEGRWDAKGILDELNMSYGSTGLATQFRDIESLFRLIPEEQTPIFVPYGPEGKALCQKWMDAREFPSLRDTRDLQTYAVQLRDAELAVLKGDIFVHPTIESFRFLANPDLYDEQRGLLLSNAGQWSAETLTV